MNLQEWAEKLNNCEYGQELSSDEKRQLKDDGVVVVFGYSDDNIELEGAITDELPAYNETIYGWYDGNFVSEDQIDTLLRIVDDEVPVLYNTVKEAVCGVSITDRSYIKSTPGNDCQFVYETNIPCEWFNIMEDEELYCKGFVFYKGDL